MRPPPQRGLASVKSGHSLSGRRPLQFQWGPIFRASGYGSMHDDQVLRAAYDAGLNCGLSINGLPTECPFELSTGIAQRIAWLSGFSVGKAVKLSRS